MFAASFSRSILPVGGELDRAGLDQLAQDILDLGRPQAAPDGHLNVADFDLSSPADDLKQLVRKDAPLGFRHLVYDRVGHGFRRTRPRRRPNPCQRHRP